MSVGAEHKQLTHCQTDDNDDDGDDDNDDDNDHDFNDVRIVI